jgi:hypothetical protein
VKAYELIEKPESWTKNYLARDKDGNPVSDYSPVAASYCVVGAICRSYSDPTRASVLCHRVSKHVGIYIVDWNNAPERTHDEVIKVLKELDI